MTRVVLCSRYAFYPIHFEAFRYLCRNYAVEGVLIGCATPDLPSVHQQLGSIDSASIKKVDGIMEVLTMPEGDVGTQTKWLFGQLDRLNPDAIWVQEEPTDYYLFQILRKYFFRRKPTIVTAVCENIFPPGSFWKRQAKKILWSRLDGLMATAKASIDGIQKAGMPKSVKTTMLVGGAFAPPEPLQPMALPFERASGDFVVGFAGRICDEKGWKVLLNAIAKLPVNIKCMLAGDGPQRDELGNWLQRPELKGRAYYVGLLPKDKLWSFYKAVDCLAVPSLTFSQWKEQFGGVIADGMALGLPVVGSDSGSIPEVIGSTGLIVPENNADALAEAIGKLRKDAVLRARLGELGKQRFYAEFETAAYARKIARSLGLSERHNAAAAVT